ncbi:hypothetical protein C8J56DRAFT_850991 [Mycena floridula]|nr:hypothetical protein C8J56DRAFT_850991 [Mycena floridula]
MEASAISTRWDTLRVEQESLFNDVAKDNEDLRTQVQKLERELSAYKTAFEAVDKRKTALEKELDTSNQSLQSIKDTSNIILVLIDGDGTIFSDTLICQGQAGGRQAALLLTQGITEHASKLDPTLSLSRAQLIVFCFCNKRGLLETLMSHNLCSPNEFQEFCDGFNQAAPLFTIVDAGPGKEAADTKIKELVRLFTPMTHTSLVVIGGAHDNGYTSSILQLENQGHARKIILLQGYDEIGAELRTLKLPVVQIEGLFMTRKLPFKRFAHPTAIAPNQFPGTLSSPKSPTHLALPKKGRALDPSLPINKQSPPPCTFHYLSKCPKGSKCFFGHDYELTEEAWSELRSYAKKWPCQTALKGTCPLTEQLCFASHHCPRGPSCSFHKQGKCKFSKADMHLPKVSPSKKSSSLSFGTTSIDIEALGSPHVERNL